MCVFFALWSDISTANNKKLSEAEAHQRLSNFIESQLIADEIHGVSLAIVHGQDIWYADGFGYSNAEEEIAATADTQFRLGAITNLFTAIMILKLESEKQLILDDKVSHFFPELVFRTRDQKQHEITIRQLLTHHSGLPLSVLKNSWAERPPSYTELFSKSSNVYLSQIPDTIYTYSNLGYALLGYIIEKVTGLSYEKAFHKYIGQVLNMQSSGISSAEQNIQNLATMYKKQVEKKPLFPRDLPSLGIYSTANDMALLLKNMNSILNNKSGLIPTSQLQKMMRIQNIHVALDLGKKLGLGWMVSGMGVENAGPVVWRAGASMYHRSRIAYLPDKKIGVIVMANDSSAWESVEKISETALIIALQSIYGIQQPEVVKQDKQVASYGVSDEFADYYNSFLGYISVDNKPESVTTEVLGWSFNIKPDGTGWYTLEYDLLGFIPINISWITDIKLKPARISGQRVVIVLYKGTQHLFASYFDKTLASKQWQQRVGEYVIANPDSLTNEMEIEEGELVIEDGYLFFLYELPMFIGMELKVPLKIINNEMAVIPGLGTALNETVSVKNAKGDEVLEYSGFEMEKNKSKGFF